MRFHLPLGFGDEAEADAVSGHAGGHAQKEAAGIPDGIQSARPSIELLQPLRAPGQVVLFLFGGLEQVAFRFVGTRHQRLAPVQGLGGNFAGVVYAHQGDAVATGVGAQIAFGDVRAGGRSCRGRWRGQGAQGLICRCDQGVQFVGSREHSGIIAFGRVVGCPHAPSVDLADDAPGYFEFSSATRFSPPAIVRGADRQDAARCTQDEFRRGPVVRSGPHRWRTVVGLNPH